MKHIFLFVILFTINCNYNSNICKCLENSDKKHELEFLEIPDNINIIFDIDKAKLCAEKNNKENILILFSRYSGQSVTPPLEWRLFNEQNIKYLNDNVVFVCLLVDDRQKAFETDSIITLGDKWTEFQKEIDSSSNQPVFVWYNIRKKNKQLKFSNIIDLDSFNKFIKEY